MSYPILVAAERPLAVADRVLAAIGARQEATYAGAHQALLEDCPRCLILDPALEHCRGLELLATLEAQDYRIPVLLPDDDAVVEESWPFDNRFLSRLRLPVVELSDLKGQLVDAVERASAAAANGAPLFTTRDYLHMAQRYAKGFVLDLVLDNGARVRLDTCSDKPTLRYQAADDHPLRELLGSPVRELACRRAGSTADAARAPASTSPPPTPRQAEAPAEASPPPDDSQRSLDDWLRAGLAAALARDFERAEACFEEARRIDPDDRRIQYNLARIAKSRGG